MLVLNPSPGVYTEPQTVTVSGPAGYEVIATNTGDDPVVVRTVVASDNFNPPLPYIQTIEDGRGRAILDGAFPKYYNVRWSEQTNPSSFANLSANFKFLYNCLQFILQGRTRLLVIGDRNNSTEPTYTVLGTGGGDFRTTLNGIASVLGISVTIRERSYWGSAVNITYADLMNYDALFFFSTESIDGTFITTAAANNIAQARRAGLGLYVLTDHDSFFKSANIIMSAITDASFEGSRDFTPGTTVGYNKGLFGDSPLFNGMSNSAIIPGDGSNSNVSQTIVNPDTLPVNLSVGEGYTTLKFAVVSPGGEVTFEQYGYNVGQPPIIELIDENGITLEEWDQTNLRQRRVNFRYLPGSFGNASGYVKVGSTVVGEFVNASAGNLVVNWLNTGYTLIGTGNLITLDGVENPDITVELYLPIVFNYVWNFNRFVPEWTPKGGLPASINRNEFSTTPDPLSPLLRASELLSRPAVAQSFTYAEYVSNVYDAMTRTIPSLLLAPSAQEIYDTFDKYQSSHNLEAAGQDSNFVIQNGHLTNTVNSAALNFLLNPDYAPSYQYVRLSSTTGDDDYNGLVVGTKVVEGIRYIMYVSLSMTDQGFSTEIPVNIPGLAIGVTSFQDISPGTAASPPATRPELSSFMLSIATFPEYPAESSQGRAGWLEPPWNLGTSMDVSFDGRRLQVRCNEPGTPASDNWYRNVSIDTHTVPQLSGFSPTGGLFNYSQPGSIWTNYTMLITE